jgi:rare lipoprotein A
MKRRISFYILLSINILLAPIYAQQKGNASYYAHRLQGKKTSSGIPYHVDSLTCAHRTLPFGTLLRVRNPQNNKTVIVKVTDRGPHSKNLLIDLSYAAAKQLDIVANGISPIEISNWQFAPTIPLLSLERDSFFLPTTKIEEIYKKMHICSDIASIK